MENFQCAVVLRKTYMYIYNGGPSPIIDPSDGVNFSENALTDFSSPVAIDQDDKAAIPAATDDNRNDL